VLVHVRLSDSATGKSLAVTDLPADTVSQWRVLGAGTGGQSEQGLGASAFNGANNLQQAIIREFALEDGAQYTVETVLTSASSGWNVRASVTLETNAPPSSGYIEVSDTTVRMLD